MAKPLSITALFKREPHLSDEARVELAKTYGLHMDPVGRSDHAVIVAGFVAYSLTALLVLYAWLNRSYRPIRAKNLVLITLILLAGVLWYIGSFVTNGLVNVVGVWKICKLWSIWVRVAFTYMFMCFILFRALALHRIFIQNKPYKGWGYYMPMAIMLAVLLVFCTAAQLISGQKTVVYQEQLEVCMYSDNFRYACLAFPWSIWIVYAVYLVRLRNIRSSFNEFMESVAIFIIGSAAMIETTMLHAIVPHYPLDGRIRLLSVCFDFVTGNLVLWILLAFPVYQRLFNREEYERRWVRKLLRDGLGKEYDV